MSNFQTTVSIADIYGAEWWERNKEELEREWEWEFGVAKNRVTVCDSTAYGVYEFPWNHASAPRIILHRRKPKPPTLREVYGVDEVTIPAGWEWTGEFRGPRLGETYSAIPGKYTSADKCSFDNPNYDPRLILRERPKKVWFKAEEKERRPVAGDWFWAEISWVQALRDLGECCLCATRHEDIDQTVPVVTQVDIDKVTR